MTKPASPKGPAWALILLALLALLVALLLVRHGWLGALAAGGGVGLGLLLRRHLIDAPRLLRAEALWAARGEASEVLNLLGPLVARGELGYRYRLLRSQALLSLGQRDAAWMEGLEAQLSRLPGWRRLLLRRYFRRVPERPSEAHLDRGARLVRLAPYMGRLRHLLGILELRRGEPTRAWVRFAEALPLSLEDPLVLEDLMLAGFSHGLEDLGERAFRALLFHHGDPRLPWDRAAAAFHLLRVGRPAEALALVEPLPPEVRTQPLHWLALSVSHRELGRREEAWKAVEEGLKWHPGAFRLWMERYLVALERQEDDEAYTSLEKAQPLIPEGPEGQELRDEWRLRRAEFAFWYDGDADTAWEELQKLPKDEQGDHHPPLRLQVQSARGEYATVLDALQPLLQAQPQDPHLLLLQGECLYGLEAWEALQDYLRSLPEPCRQFPQYWHLLGLGLAQQDDPAAARQELERAARMDPHHLRYLLDAGHACAELGEWDRAESHWRQALALEPQDEEALIDLAEARQELGDAEGARRYLRECLLHHPDSAEAQDRLAGLEAN